MDLSHAKVVVTGADGFIGSHLVERLVALGADVTAFCYYNSFGSLGWIDTLDETVAAKLRIVAGDVRDPHGMREALRGHDVVFHLAALVGIPFSYHSPDAYVETNVKGTLNVLNAARDLGLERVVVTSTSEVYGTALAVPISETHPRQAQSPYSATKIGADALAEAYHRAFGMPVTVIRPFNTYGPRQSARAVIPTIVTQLLSGADELRLGSLAPTRDLTYVTDTCEGFVALAEADGAVGRDVNLGTGTEISVGELARTLMTIVGREVPVVTEDDRVRPEDSEVERLVSDTSLVAGLCGWSAKVPLMEGLERTVEWFRGEQGRSWRARGYQI